jgi:hypothetical protein
MLPLLLGWAVMVATMLGLAWSPPGRPVLLYWASVSLLACILGALAIASQPLGQATLAGRFGSSVVRWGFRATQGKLAAAAAISWIIWLAVGSAAIVAVRARGDLSFRLMLLAWTIDFGALCYVLGVWLMNRGSGRSTLLVVAAALIGMLGISAALWFGNSGPATRRTALMLAGGPPLVIGVGYGLFLLVVLTVGRNARWN